MPTLDWPDWFAWLMFNQERFAGGTIECHDHLKGYFCGEVDKISVTTDRTLLVQTFWTAHMPYDYSREAPTGPLKHLAPQDRSTEHCRFEFVCNDGAMTRPLVGHDGTVTFRHQFTSVSLYPAGVGRIARPQERKATWQDG